MIDAEATENEALSDRTARITFPVPLSMHSLQKILYNKNNAERVQNYDAHKYHGVGCENNTARTYHGTGIKTKSHFWCPISDSNHGVSNFGLKSQNLNPRAKTQNFRTMSQPRPKISIICWSI